MVQGLGEIVLGTYGAVRDASQQRFSNRMEQERMRQRDYQIRQDDRRLDILANADRREQEATDRSNAITDNDDFINTLDTLGLVSPDRLSLDVDKLSRGIGANEGSITAVALDIATRSGLLPDGSVAESIQPLPDGGFAVTVRNKDGSLGAVTDDGSSDDQSRVVSLSADAFGRVSNTLYQTKILPNSSFDPTIMRTQLTRIEADAEGRALQDRLQDTLFKSQVVNAVPMEGGAQRAAINAISAAGSPEEERQVLEAIAADVGIEPPSREKTQPNQLRGRNAESRRRSEQTRVTNIKEALAAEQEKLEAARSTASARPGRPAEAAKTRISGIERNIAQLNEQLKGTADPIVVQTPEAEDEIEQVATAAAGKTTQEIANGVASGAITISQTTQQQIAANLEQQGIRELRDLLRLNERDRAIARAAILASSPNSTIQAQMSKEISNIFETGKASVSASDEMGFQQNQDTLRLRLAELRRNLANDLEKSVDDATDNAVAFTQVAQTYFFGEDGSELNLNPQAASRFTRTILAPYLLRASNSQTPQEAATYARGLSPALSLTIAAFAREEEGGAMETLLSFFRADSEDVLTTTDFDLNRVRATFGRNGAIDQFFYTDANGNPTDEAVDAKVIQDLNDDIYRIIASAARRNTQDSERQ